MSVDEIVETISKMSNIGLESDKRKRLKKWIDRTAITIRHIRK